VSVAAPPRLASTSLRAGIALALGPVRRRRTLGIVFASVAMALLGAVLMRRAGVSGALERSLGASFGWVVPLASFVVANATLGQRNLREGVWGAARFGHSRAFVGVGRASVALALSAAIGSLAGLAAVLGVLPHPGVALLAELYTVGWIGALVGASYGAWFAFASSFGRRAQGRMIFLVLDFVVGAWGPFGLVFPRGLGHDLLALEAPLALPQRAASALLLVGVLVLLAGVAQRTGDARRA
jgi:hypothetical protein